MPIAGKSLLYLYVEKCWHLYSVFVMGPWADLLKLWGPCRFLYLSWGPAGLLPVVGHVSGYEILELLPLVHLVGSNLYSSRVMSKTNHAGEVGRGSGPTAASYVLL